MRVTDFISAANGTGTTGGGNRLSDIRVALFGGRGGITDELKFWQVGGYTTQTTHKHLSEVWIDYAATQKSIGNNRWTEVRNAVTESKDFNL